MCVGVHTLNFLSFFLSFFPLSQMSPLFFLAGKLCKDRETHSLKYRGMFGGEGQRCEVQRVLQLWCGGIMVHCESLLSNGAFSHYIAHTGCMVPGCTEVSLTQRERGKDRERR